MSITTAEVAHLAGLARIQLSDDELEFMAPQLDVILQAVAEVSSVASEDVAPTSHALDLTNVFREDRVGQSLPQEAVLSQAPAVEDERFRVPRILEEQA